MVLAGILLSEPALSTGGYHWSLSCSLSYKDFRMSINTIKLLKGFLQPVNLKNGRLGQFCLYCYLLHASESVKISMSTYYQSNRKLTIERFI